MWRKARKQRQSQAKQWRYNSEDCIGSANYDWEKEEKKKWESGFTIGTIKPGMRAAIVAELTSSGHKAAAAASHPDHVIVEPVY